MKTALTWLIRVALLAVAVKAGLWAWEKYGKPDSAGQDEVIDGDKICRIVSVDTGQCVCRHRLTNKMLEVSHQECHALARSR